MPDRESSTGEVLPWNARLRWSPVARTAAPRPASAKFCLECAHPVDGTTAAQPRFAAPESYTPRHLAEKILMSKAALEGERKQATVLFADLIPACDSAGEVMSVGVGVTTFKAGDRVANTYFGAWDSGKIAPWKVADSFGANIDGVLAEEIVVPQNCLAMLPAHVDFTEGATFTCAGVTAWNALFVAAGSSPAPACCCWAPAASRSGACSSPRRRA